MSVPFVPAVLGALVPWVHQPAMAFSVWLVAVLAIVIGGLGVVMSRNPVHSALMLVLALFGVAVLFVALQANFLAAVQLIVYAGAIVVLFLFVIMFLGVDRPENLADEPLRFQWPLAVVAVVLMVAGLVLLARSSSFGTGARSVAGAAQGQPGGDVAALGRSVFTTYLFAFEVTGALLVIAVVGAVVLARRPRGAVVPAPEEDDVAGENEEDLPSDLGEMDLEVPAGEAGER